MLVVMTFNIQYFVSLTLGLAVAHFTWNLSNCNAQYASREGNDGNTIDHNRRYVISFKRWKRTVIIARSQLSITIAAPKLLHAYQKAVFS